MRLVAVDNIWRQPYSRESNHISQYYLNMWCLRDHRFHLGNIIWYSLSIYFKWQELCRRAEAANSEWRGYI